MSTMAAVVIAATAVSVGLLNAAVFLHPIALAILPGTIMRVLVVAAIGAGTNAIAFGARFYVDTTPAPDSWPDPDSAARLRISAEPPTPKSFGL